MSNNETAKEQLVGGLRLFARFQENNKRRQAGLTIDAG